jgi:hypothetical protein
MFVTALEARKRSISIARRKIEDAEKIKATKLHNESVKLYNEATEEYDWVKRKIAICLEESTDKLYAEFCWDYITFGKRDRRPAIVKAVEMVLKELSSLGYTYNKPYISQGGYIIFRIKW